MVNPLSDGFARRLPKITDWVFDLDNTLYPRHCDLFAQIDWKMTDYVARELGLAKDKARIVQKQLYRTHGTTLRGLMDEHGVDPHHFIADVHDIDYSPVPENPVLGDAISKLPGRKHIFTNGDVEHAKRTTDQLGISHLFDGVFDIVAADFVPKPAAEPYRQFLSDHDINPRTAIMFEDMPRNLMVPNALGMATVLVLPHPDSDHSAEGWEHQIDDHTTIDHVTHNIDETLGAVVRLISD
ncbi:MAG: pyrimidine 5'-nucleotidase [Pseudomonadota bacterium]